MPLLAEEQFYGALELLIEQKGTREQSRPNTERHGRLEHLVLILIE